MTETLQTAGLPRQGVPKQTAAVALTALGVVYGDIGTSTLYGLKQAVEAAGAPTPDTVMGIVSLILWALLLIVALKYAILILRADNHGEGGIVALLALLDARHGRKHCPMLRSPTGICASHLCARTPRNPQKPSLKRRMR